MSFETNYTKYF